MRIIFIIKAAYASIVTDSTDCEFELRYEYSELKLSSDDCLSVDAVTQTISTALGIDAERIGVFSKENSPHESYLTDIIFQSEPLRLTAFDLGPQVSEERAREAHGYLLREGSRLVRKTGSSIIELLGNVPVIFALSLENELPSIQAMARKLVPADALHENAIVNERVGMTYREALLKELMHWFLQFFKWDRVEKCHCCRSEKNMKFIRNEPPSEEERITRHIQTFEVYQCSQSDCDCTTRHPRIFTVTELLKTRTGWCGQWSLTFGLFARALGFKVRYVFSPVFNHIWNEVLVDGRWVYIDSITGAFDTPLQTEMGWDKNQKYVFAVSRDGVFDVTETYSSREVLGNRLREEDEAIKLFLQQLNGIVQSI